jgi:hypothetical protein
MTRTAIVALLLTLLVVQQCHGWMTYKTKEQAEEDKKMFEQKRTEKEQKILEARKRDWDCSGAECVFVKEAEGTRKVRLHITRDETTVSQVKALVQEKLGIPVADQTLKFENRVAHDEDRVSEYSVPMAGTFQLFVGLTKEQIEAAEAEAPKDLGENAADL